MVTVNMVKDHLKTSRGRSIWGFNFNLCQESQKVNPRDTHLAATRNPPRAQMGQMSPSTTPKGDYRYLSSDRSRGGRIGGSPLFTIT